MQRAQEETGNLRATRHVRAMLETFSSLHRRDNRGGGRRFGRGVVGLVSDLGTISDPRIACAVSTRRRAAMSTVIVTDEGVIRNFRRSGLYIGPVNFLPLTALHQVPPALSAVLAGWVDDNVLGRGRGSVLLPLAPETPSPPGFLGYAVRLLQLRPEHEPLRWTVFFALFKDLVIFETTDQAEAVRVRAPNQKLYYCALDYVGAQDEQLASWALPHIGHWDARPLFVHGVSETEDDAAWKGAGAEKVGDAIERLEKAACFARSSLAFLRYGGGVVRLE